MTVHNAKGLEFDVVAVPDLSRSLLAGARAPLLVLGREQPPRVGMQLRRLGSGAVNLFDYAELCEEAKARDAEEGLRLFHVAATRARERLILSGVVKPEAGTGDEAGHAGDRAPGRGARGRARRRRRRGGAAAGAAPGPGRELRPRGDRGPRQPPLARARGASCGRPGRDPAADRPLGDGPPPLVERRPPIVPSRPLSYTAISAYEECPYRFYMERVLGLGATRAAVTFGPHSD